MNNEATQMLPYGELGVGAESIRNDLRCLAL